MAELRAGAARVDVTPPLGVPYLGYEPRHAYFRGVHDPLYARAAVLDDGRTRIAIVSVDSIGFDEGILGDGRNFVAEVRRRASEGSGVPEGNVTVAATHAHSTPETLGFRPLPPRASAWADVLADQMASAVRMAVEDLKPATLRVGKGKLVGVAKNRRTPGGPTDPEVGVVLVERDGGGPIILFKFACHPVTVQVQPLVSADFPGEACRILERETGGRALFLQGACGDQNPVRGTTGFEDVVRYGRALGGEVLKGVGMLSLAPPEESPVLSVRSEKLYLPRRPLPEREPFRRKFEEVGDRLGSVRDEGERRRLLRERRLAEEVLVLIDRTPDPVPAEVQLVRMGDLALVCFPGEPFVEVGMEVGRRSPARSTFVVGYANGYVGYLATDKAWDEGGYEVGLGPWCRVGPDGTRTLVEAAVRLLWKIWEEG